MRILTKNTIEELIQKQKGWCLSIYMPAHSTAAETQQDKIRFKNMIREAENRLQENGLRSSEAREFLEPLKKLLGNEPFWQHQRDGLAVFMSDDIFRYFRLPEDFKELLVVARRFHLKPLLSFLSNDGRFYILAVSQNKTKLFLGTHYTISEIDEVNIPGNLAEALQYDDPERQLQFHTQTGGEGKRAAMFHGQGVGTDDGKNNLMRYFRQIDKGLHSILKEERAPLVLASVAYLFPIYREQNTYPYFVNEGIKGNPDELPTEELHKQAWDIVRPVFLKAMEEALDKYKLLEHTEQASDNMRVIIPAAYHGRVDVLFVAVGLQEWGSFDQKKNSIDLHDEPEGDNEDLLDFAAVQTVLNGGTVYALSPDNMPDNRKLMAIFRY
jgi:hypothetical protein